jgi:ABC-type antimicrobial peptide transport system permease subunit
MRFRDIVGLALEALSQQKLRTALTSLGVICGSFVLVISLSLRQGVQETILREISRFGDLRRVEVMPRRDRPSPSADLKPPEIQGDMSPERRARLQAEMQRRFRPPQVTYLPTAPLNDDRLALIEKLPRVRSVTLDSLTNVEAILGDKTQSSNLVSAKPGDDEFRQRLIAGGYFHGDNSDEVLVTEFCLYHLGIIRDADVSGVIGRKLRIERREPTPNPLGHLWPEKTLAEYTICGVLGAADADKPRGRWDWQGLQADLVLPPRTMRQLVARFPSTKQYGYDSALIDVDDGDNVKEVVQQIKAMNLHADAMLERVEVERFIYHMVFSGMSLVAGVALIVAAMGIANTMLMGVLQRMREIGVMKAVGARDGHIVAIFLVEGATIGLVGGLLGLGLAWGLSGPGDAWMQSILEKNTSIKLHGSVFAFPPWLLIGVPAFACLTTTLAAVYPARRASRIDPVAALRHE